MKKCLSICKIRCFVKVARWRKNTSSYAQIRYFLTEISWKITQKSIKRVGKHASSTKIYKNTACGVIFLGWNWFWVNFCCPEGAQKTCKIYEEFLAKRSWQPSGSNFACFSVFFWIFGFVLGSLWASPKPVALVLLRLECCEIDVRSRRACTKPRPGGMRAALK